MYVVGLIRETNRLSYVRSGSCSYRNAETRRDEGFTPLSFAEGQSGL